MKKTTALVGRTFAIPVVAALALVVATPSAGAGQSLDIPSKTWGISFGNSKSFTGLRFNFRDGGVGRVRGVNITLWQPRKDNKDAVIQGLSLGLLPGGGTVSGIQLGILGASADKDLKGVSLGLLGAGAGGDIVGLNAGGLGAGAGGNVTGINLGGLGVGAGGDIKGITIGGLGAGTGGSMTGVNIGGLGVGAGTNMSGLNLGGIGAGAGDNMTGINVGGIGVGAGEVLSGISIGGIGVGAGERLTGVGIGGIGAGAPEIRGLAVGGLGVGGNDLRGIFLAGGFIMVDVGGRLTGLAASSFNYVRGAQTGLSVGIVNYAWSVKGLQVGLVNIVRDNPPGLRVLPVFNTSF